MGVVLFWLGILIFGIWLITVFPLLGIATVLIIVGYIFMAREENSL